MKGSFFCLFAFLVLIHNSERICRHPILGTYFKETQTGKSPSDLMNVDVSVHMEQFHDVGTQTQNLKLKGWSKLFAIQMAHLR